MSLPSRSTPELLPVRTTYPPTGPVLIEARGVTGTVRVTVRRLGDVVRQWTGELSAAHIDVQPLEPGCYGVDVQTANGDTLRTAIEITVDPQSRLRYGFVAQYRPGGDLAGVVDNIRRLHLNGVQLYDWAYRHADLLGGGEEYLDALGQPISLETVRDLVKQLHAAGSDALGYAAVYGVGPQEWPSWEHLALLQSDGAPYGLGDFLFLVDPAAPAWLEHFTKDLRRAVEYVGLDGFHLDQYGYPRRAVGGAGQAIDLTASFRTLIQRVRAALPDERLIFNNVNDFPTAATAGTPQDAVYIEVWDPHLTLGHLGRVVTRARAAGSGKPVVIAAYQHVYDVAPARPSDLAASFTMATLWSHGATHLLAGEADRILVDPYYVRNHRIEDSIADLLHRWYDFLVEHDEILLDPALVDVTGAWAGAYNDAADISYGQTQVTDESTPGSVWRRITESPGGRLTFHLVNLAGQNDTLWDAPRAEPAPVGPGRLRMRRVGQRVPRVRVADPDRSPHLVDMPVDVDGEYAFARLPEPHVWQTVVVDLA